MTHNIAAPVVNSNKGIDVVSVRRLLFLLIVLLAPAVLRAQSDEPVADEITVSLEFKGVGSTEIPAMYNDKDVFLAVSSVFDFLRIKNVPTQSFDTISGFFLTEQDRFLLDRIHNRIYYQGKVIESKDGFLKSETSLYMNLKYFKSVFGLDGAFYFRRLVVTMSSESELPIIREMRQDLMRKNVNRLTGDVKADTTINLRRPFFHFGMADWAIMSSQQSQGADQTTLNLGLGGELAGGEVNASLNYYSNQPLSEKLQYYQWRYVNNDMAAMRQVVAGKIFTQATSSLFAPVVGVQVTNAPTTYRQSYGTYRLSNTTEPGWTVELYVNDVLVDYTKADGAGFYSFDVPLIYGFTIVKLKFYGPYGEQRTSQQYINIPFNFLPKHEFEYSVSGGIVEDNQNSNFTRTNLKYGLSSRITVGGGLEYLSSVKSGPAMPFVNTSFRITQRLLLSGEYTHGVRSRALLSYRFKNNAQLDLDYINYVKGQTAIYFNYLEERKAVLTMPLRAKRMSLFSRFTVDQIIVPTTQYTNMEWAMIGFYRKIGINFTTYASVIKSDLTYLYSIASLTVPLPLKILMTSQVQYDFKTGAPVFARFNFERHLLGKGFLNVGYQEYFNINNRNFLVGLRYDFSFARAVVSVLSGSDGSYSRVEAASGSLIYDGKSNYLNANSRMNVGKGGMLIIPYLDLNHNHKKDKGEPRAAGLKLRINGGRVMNDDHDTCIRILDLEPYYKYYVELNKSSFDNISWRIRNATLSITASPNDLTLVEVPISVVGEVSGTVSVNGNNDEKPKGLGQVLLDIYDETGFLVGKAVTESDGYFSFMGLEPGNYTVKIDSVQLARLQYAVSPAVVPLIIKESVDGDVADGVEFTLTGKVENATENAATDTRSSEGLSDSLTKRSIAITDAKLGKAGNNTQGTEVVGKEGTYAILVEVYADIKQAGRLKTRLNHAFKGIAVSIGQDGDDYKVEMVGFAGRSVATKCLSKLKDLGYPEALVIRLKERVMK